MTEFDKLISKDDPFISDLAGIAIQAFKAVDQIQERQNISLSKDQAIALANGVVQAFITWRVTNPD